MRSLDSQGGYATNQGGNIICHENLSGSVTLAEQAAALRRGASHSYQFAYTRNIQGIDEDIAPTLRNGGAGCGSYPMVGVRRLTPTECERLQGFPDGWTEGLSDSARYKCLGNAVTVNVAEWIGKRLMRC